MQPLRVAMLALILCLGCDGAPPPAGRLDAATADAGPAEDAGGGSCGEGVDAGLIGTVRVEDTCPELIACGGDEVGDWCYSEVCITREEVLAPILEQASILPGCGSDQIAIDSAGGTVEGILTLDGTSFEQRYAMSIDGMVTLLSGCIFLSCGTTGSTVDGALRDAGLGTTSCVSDPSCAVADCRCLCEISLEREWTETGTYVADRSSGRIITEGDRQLAYCAEGGTLRFREVDSTASEPGVHAVVP